MMMRKTPLFALVGLLLLTACSSSPKVEANYPDPDEERLYRYGSLSGEDGVSLFGKGKKEGEDQTGIGVNSFLWRAALDTVSFMPMASADPFGGLIVTDWYASSAAPNERSKAQIYILSRELKADAVKVSLFRQVRDAKGEWVDAPIMEGSPRKLEDAILARARQIRQDNLAR